MTKTETAKILATIASVYQNFDVNDFKQSIWHELLKDTDYKHASMGTVELLRCMKFPPTPADIIEKAKLEKLFDFERKAEVNTIEYDGNRQIS